MPLEFQKVPIAFQAGADTKTDSKSVQGGKLLRLENATFVAPGAFNKPVSHAALPSNPSTSDVRAVAQFKSEILAADGSSLYAWSGSAWSNRGAYVPVATSRTQLVTSPLNDVEAIDSAVDSITGLQVIVYATTQVDDTTAVVCYRVVDAVTKRCVVSDTILAYGGTQPRVVVTNGYALVSCFVTGGGLNVYGYWIPLATPSTPGGAFTIGALETGTPFDVVSDFNAVYTATKGTSHNILVQKFSPGATTASASVSATSSNAPVAVCLLDTSGTIFLAWTSSTNLQLACYSTALAQTQAPTAILTASNLCTLGLALTASDKLGFVTLQRASASDMTLRYNNRTICGTVSKVAGVWGASGSNVTMRSIGPVARPVAYLGAMYWFGTHSGYDQGTSTYFLFNGAGLAVGKMLQGAAGFVDGARAHIGGYPASSGVYSPVLPSSRVSGAVLTTSVKEAVSDGTIQLGTEISADMAAPVYSLESGGSMLFSGGFPWEYDGAVVTEHGFHMYPAKVTISPHSAGSTFTYFYQSWYEWRDAQGRRHRSAPSPIASVGVSDAIDDSHWTEVTVPTLRVTTGKTNIRIGVGRSTSTNSNVYEISSCYYPGSLTNFATSDSVTITDKVPDSSLNGKPLVNTGALDSIEPGGIGQIIEHRGRAIAVDTEFPERVWASKIVQDGLPVEFNDALLFLPDSSTDPILGVASMDDKLVLFKSNRTLFTTGVGPDDTGNNSDWTSPAYRIAGDLGCVDPRSVCVSSLGVARMTEKGLYLLNRGLEDRYIGAEAEGLIAAAGGSVSGAVAVDSAQQLQFLVNGANGGLAVYDYLVQQWSFQPIANCSLILNGGGSFGLVYASGPAVYVESAGAAYLPFGIETAWIQLGGVQGYQRARKLFVLGDWKSPHRLTVKVAYDFDETAVQTFVVDSMTAPTSGPFQLRLDLQRQKCEALKVSISDAVLGVGAGQGNKIGLSLSSLLLEIGVKRGARKMPATAHT